MVWHKLIAEPLTEPINGDFLCVCVCVCVGGGGGGGINWSIGPLGIKFNMNQNIMFFHQENAFQKCRWQIGCPSVYVEDSS